MVYRESPPDPTAPSRCAICDRHTLGPHCEKCLAISELIPTLEGPVSVVVDSSYDATSRVAGAGLVLVDHREVVAWVACRFSSLSHLSAEIEALNRGARLASGIRLVSSSEEAVTEAQRRGLTTALWIRSGPHNDLAYQLSGRARIGELVGVWLREDVLG
jgi:hypothetical protein